MNLEAIKLTAIKTALKEIYYRGYKWWVIYTDSQSFMQSIEFDI